MFSRRLPILVLSCSLATAGALAQSPKADAFGGVLGSSAPLSKSAPSTALTPTPAPKTKQVARKTPRRAPSSSRSSESVMVPFDGPGGATSGTLRDGRGSISESVSVGVDGRSTTRRNARGSITSTGSVSPDGKSTTYRDGNGTIVGRVDINPDGDRSTARDASGRIQYTTSTSGSRTTFRGANGLIIGTKDITPAGNVVYRNADGLITGPDFK